jgi:predicted DNA-binding protein (UPF0251 family)
MCSGLDYKLIAGKIDKMARGRPKKNKTNQLTPKDTDNPKNTLEPYNYKIDLSEAIKLRYKNKLTYEAIGKQFHCSAQAVHELIQGFLKGIDDPGIIQSFEDIKPEILSSVERKLIENILDSDKLKKANLNNVAYAFTQIHQANRLQRGQATSITDDMSNIIDRIEQRYTKAIDVTPIPDNTNDNQ